MVFVPYSFHGYCNELMKKQFTEDKINTHKNSVHVHCPVGASGTGGGGGGEEGTGGEEGAGGGEQGQ